MAYTLEQLSEIVDDLTGKLDCFCNDDPCSTNSCEYDSGISWTEQTGGIQYSIVVSYIDPSANINTQLINTASTTVQTPQQFLDILNGIYGPSMVFSLNGDGTVHLVAEGFAAACYLQIINNQRAPNTTASWESGNALQINVISVFTTYGEQGYYNGEPWGNLYTPPTPPSIGYLPFDGDTDKISFTYEAAISSAASVCVHLIQDGSEIWSSPFNLNIPTAGFGTVELTGLTGLLDPAYDLTILVNDAC